MLAAIAWVVIFPLGSIVLRTVHSKGAWKLHAAVQLIAMMTFITAVGIGIWLTIQWARYTPIWNDPHIVIGLVIFSLMICQPVIGYIHHLIFIRRANGRRTGFGHIHVWLGRILIVLGMVNGGLGLRLAGQSPLQSYGVTRRAEIGYSVVAGFVFLLYASIATWSEKRRAATPSFAMRGDEGNGAASSENTLSSLEYKVYRTADGPIVRSSVT